MSSEESHSRSLPSAQGTKQPCNVSHLSSSYPFDHFTHIVVFVPQLQGKKKKKKTEKKKDCVIVSHTIATHDGPTSVSV